MFSDNPAISVRGLGKSYRIAHGGAWHLTSLKEAIGARLARPFRNGNDHGHGHGPIDGHPLPHQETFWALRDVDFDLPHGKVLGLIGRNGAGKSTLLKLLSQITEPTTGQIEIFGRVASLLEVGTGFHPELTGRENTYLNGAILGMRRREIARRFDAIVDFAGIERFLDTPVKHYSSGMYVRLAFAVAAHLETEILVVDEVLAVGDDEFQRKCLSKIEQVAQQDGRTIILVSHTMASVEKLCDRAIFLDHGRIIREGPAREIVSQYLASAGSAAENGTQLSDWTHRTGNGKLRFTSFHIEDDAGNPVTHVASGRDVHFVLGYEAADASPLNDVDVGISVHSGPDTTLFVIYSSYTGESLRVEQPSGTFRCSIPRLPLPAGTYHVGARMTVGGEEADWPRDRVGTFHVEAGDFYGSGCKGCDSATAILVDGRWGVGAS
jgi:lipopolysaccharide transport system ATP-binding protein